MGFSAEAIVGDSVGERVGDGPGSLIVDRVGDPVSDSVGDDVGFCVADLVGGSVGERVGDDSGFARTGSPYRRLSRRMISFMCELHVRRPAVTFEFMSVEV